jgi:deoxyribodipyrimidine photo-lyase
MNETGPAILWFRRDLRLADNPALTAAVHSGREILPLYILDDVQAGEWKTGAAGRWWLHRSLSRLSESLDGKLILRAGESGEVLLELIEQSGAKAVFWNRVCEAQYYDSDELIENELERRGIAHNIFKDALLSEPHESMKPDRTPYRVFTPYYQRCLKNACPAKPLSKPANLMLLTVRGDSPDSLALLPKEKWYKRFEELWQPGEAGALKRLDTFSRSGLQDYKDGRDYPSKESVSRLSPHLHFGEISPRQLLCGVEQAAKSCAGSGQADCFIRQLYWREFSHNLLYFWPEMPTRPLTGRFRDFPWRSDSDSLRRWQLGTTGIPIVDAGMRELWQTGYMHNRVRMICGSFLVKNLLIDWRLGEKWFWDTLLDADLANNSMGWQWVAGCGADAAPYFRVFNPVLQGQKFDAAGEYVRRFVPELAALDKKYIHCPWQASDKVLAEAGVRLGKDYPEPIVDLKASRDRALAAYKQISGKLAEL